MRRQRLADDERAAVYVEFLIAFMPMFTMFLGMMQIGLLFAGRLVVDHAAYTAARSAAVILPDDATRYGDAAQDQVSYNGMSASDVLPTEVLGLAEALGLNIPEMLFTDGDGRLNRVRIAAMVPLLGITPSRGHLEATAGFNLGPNGETGAAIDAIGFTGGTGLGAIGQRVLAGFLYLSGGMAVTFPPEPGGAAPYGDGVNVGGHTYHTATPFTTRVTFAHPCGVPLAASLVCAGWNRFPGAFPEASEELNNAAPLRAGQGVFFGRGYYFGLRSDVRMAYQGALYEYNGGDEEE